jgi:pullulanase/glycogen debranching enzyme
MYTARYASSFAAQGPRGLFLPCAQGGTWHVLVPGLSPSMLYGFRVFGPSAPTLGHRFNSDAVVLDPYARGVVSRPRFCEPGAEENCWPQMAATLPLADAPFDWEGATSPNRALEDLVVYECHVRGFTRHPSSGTSFGIDVCSLHC